VKVRSELLRNCKLHPCTDDTWISYCFSVQNNLPLLVNFNRIIQNLYAIQQVLQVTWYVIEIFVQCATLKVTIATEIAQLPNWKYEELYFINDLFVPCHILWLWVLLTTYWVTNYFLISELQCRCVKIIYWYFNILNTNILTTNLYTLDSPFSSFLYNEISLCAIYKTKVVLSAASWASSLKIQNKK
jgi:hypothetical protein